MFGTVRGEKFVCRLRINMLCRKKATVHPYVTFTALKCVHHSGRRSSGEPFQASFKYSYQSSSSISKKSFVQGCFPFCAHTYTTKLLRRYQTIDNWVGVAQLSTELLRSQKQSPDVAKKSYNIRAGYNSTHPCS